MQRAVNALQMQGEFEDEQDMGPEEPAQEDPMQQQVAEPAEPAAIVNCMKVSTSAYTGTPSSDTISLSLKFGKLHAVALADTRSTNTFMYYEFAVQNNIPMTSVSAKTVTVAGGGTLISDAVATNCSFNIQGQQFNSNFRILHLQGSDIILGVNWFKQYNPVTFDFVERTL